ncbi:T9SS type A sorting domain-containing protein, partial [Kaistella sp.]|uniref:T9SS type A sorting domain-containing protein n=1 Tax=Kaistella sp. TaxID=2782235 RepID=UPI002F931F10
GANANYGDNQTIIKTFYPTNPSDKVKITFTEFDLETGYDFMNIYNGPNTGSPRFTGATQITGNTIPGPFQSTHASGAITVRFISDAGATGTGWSATLDCVNVLATGEVSATDGVSIAQTSVKGIFTVKSKDKIESYSVFDASGKLVKTSGKLNAGEEKIDLSASPKGGYVISVKTSKETVTKKVIR